MSSKTNFIEELAWRGLLQDVSDEAGLRKVPVGTPFYFGVDPTASSLHLGNLSSMMTAFHMAKCGMKPIMLFGGATGFIGDPRASSERELLSRETIQANVKSITTQVRGIFARVGIEADYVDNFDWTHNVSILDFLRDVGKHFTVNYMIAKDTVKTRMEGDGISYTEFSYMLLQGFDFLHLHKTKGCKIQIGGSDQWGNMTAGLELIRRTGQGEAFALSSPLMLDSQGKKMGKSEGGALWLDGKLFTPYKMHQFLLNVADADVIGMLKRFTFLSRDEISAIEKEAKAAPEKRQAQKILADTVCAYLHGEDAVAKATRSAQVLFGGSFEGLTDNDLLEIFADVPSHEISRQALGTQTALDLFVTAGLAKSKGEAKRLVENGGAYVNNVRVMDGQASAGSLSDAHKGAVLVLRSGKKNYSLLKLVA